uniref:Major sperm protein n=1 Tax=Caenorhabditis tropicalis TaxID=1561998 RepID=A0A1I7UPJ2_9PELO
MTKEASSVKPKEENGTPDRFSLEVTPGKLVVPSSGILDEEIKNTLTFDKSHELGCLHIKCSYHIQSVRPNPGDTKYASGFHLDSNRYFLLSIDPECEKAKELAERFSEHLKQHVRKDRVITCSYEEDKNWMTEELNLECYTDNPKKREQMEKWNEEILTKYGKKLDQMSNDELRKIKEGYRDPNGEAKKLELKEKQAEEQLKKDIAAQNERNERKLSTRIKKKCMIM